MSLSFLFWYVVVPGLLIVALVRIYRANQVVLSARQGYRGVVSQLAGTYGTHLGIIVLLKGYPEHNEAMSVINGNAALKLVKELLLEDPTGYFTIILSTGVTEGRVSEASATLALLDQSLLSELQSTHRVKIVLEEKSFTTRTNMRECDRLMRRSFDGPYAILTNSEWPCGHAQRGYMLRGRLNVYAIIPAHKLEQGYVCKLYYDLGTGLLTGMGLSFVLDIVAFLQIKLGGKRFQYAKSK